MRSMIQSVIFLITSILLLSAVVFAWFTITIESKIQPINANIIKRDVNFDVEYGKNGGSYVSFNDPADINAYLMALSAGDRINIKVTVYNANDLGSPDLPLSIRLFNIRATETNDGVSLMDFYTIENRNIQLTWYDNQTDFNNETPSLIEQIELDLNDPTEVVYDGLPLLDDRLSNLLDYYTNEFDEIVYEPHISIFNGYMPSQNILVIEFVFFLDYYTPEGLGYEDGELKIDGLYSFFDE